MRPVLVRLGQKILALGRRIKREDLLSNQIIAHIVRVLKDKVQAGNGTAELVLLLELNSKPALNEIRKLVSTWA